jgi:purine-binding chemotaxis protein CheW
LKVAPWDIIDHHGQFVALFFAGESSDMDILAARKKAAKQAKARNKLEKAQTNPQQAEQSSESAPVVQQASAPSATPAAAPVQEAAGTIMEKPAAAAEPEATKQPVEEIELLSFRIGGEEYALMVDDVREVLKIVPMTMVPNAPDFILGVMSLRGKVTPIIDLCKRLGLQPGVRDEKSRIIVVSTDEEDIGLVVDRVTGVLTVFPDEIKPAPENVEQGAGYIRGITRKGDRLHILLDLKKAVAMGD